MITKNEVTTLDLSPTKKDFVQIWNELLEVAGKITERWDPTSTNESDPGIVILKALTGIADRLNYNIDKNILEAFMPTAAQEESMRKLCEMMGYNMKYLQSAATEVTIRYSNPEPSTEEQTAMQLGIPIPKFTTITSADNTINYFTTNPVDILISTTSPEVKINCLEGQIVKCESLNDNKVITIEQLTDNNRFYLPEVQIAENGIFVYNVGRNGIDNSLVDGRAWKRVDNLNTQSRRSYVFKFGFDSYEDRPYLEFPEDVSELIEEGFFIYYTRTNGINGNISPRMLSRLEAPNSQAWENIDPESFFVENMTAATSGSNIETIEQAYNNFKKTIGTFETLVTCRDYMNKIYSMSSFDNKPYVSNILVTDIRNDLNRAITICSCDDSGIYYKEKPLADLVASSAYKPVFVPSATDPTAQSGSWKLGSADSPFNFDIKDHITSENKSTFNSGLVGEVIAGDTGHWVIIQRDPNRITETVSYTTNLDTLATKSPLIDHFDLVFYPFKTYNKITSNVRDIEGAYDTSFTYSEANLDIIEAELQDTKTIAHKISKPRVGDIVSINNYLRLNTFIATTNKVTAEEGALIIDNVKKALANAFNLHELDFGEEIPFENILEVIEKADSRIKLASLNDPTLYTTFSVLTGYNNGLPRTSEYAVASSWLEEAEAMKLNRLYEVVPEYLTSANFYIEKDPEADFIRIYTLVNKQKKYLRAYQVVPGRDKDVFICLDSYDSNKNYEYEWYYNTRTYNITGVSTSTNFNFWSVKLPKDPDDTTKGTYSFFLGAYNDNKTITISSTDWLPDTTNPLSSLPAEYPANFCTQITSSDLYDTITPVGFSALTTPEALTANRAYKLFICHPGYVSSYTGVSGQNLFALPKISADHRNFSTTSNPLGSTIEEKKDFLFDTDEARKIYNKLALRNVLAGRVPLFNYNKVFKTNFTESIYQITTEISPSTFFNSSSADAVLSREVQTAITGHLVPASSISKANLVNEVVANPVKLYYAVNKSDEFELYTRQFLGGASKPEVSALTKDTILSKLHYTRTYNPIQTLIEGEGSETIKELSTSCKIKIENNPDTGYQEVKDIELKSGEIVKFRAPNFITKVTYPAYVNYHLQLQNAILQQAEPSKGASVLDILSAPENFDFYQLYNSANFTTNWDKVFAYFKANDFYKRQVKTFTTSLKVSVYKPFVDSSGNDPQDTGANVSKIAITIPVPDEDEEIPIDAIFRRSGCIRCTNELSASTENGYGIVPDLAWNKLANGSVEGDGDFTTVTDATPDLRFVVQFDNNNSRYLYNVDSYYNLQTAIQDKIIELKSCYREDNEGNPVYRTDKNGNIIYEVDLDGNFVYETDPVTGEQLKDPTTGEPIKIPVKMPVLPESCSWYINLTFEYIPFVAETYSMWRDLLSKYCSVFDYKNTALEKWFSESQSLFLGLNGLVAPDDSSTTTTSTIISTSNTDYFNTAINTFKTSHSAPTEQELEELAISLGLNTKFNVTEEVPGRNEILFRLYSGNTYDTGKFITEGGNKFVHFKRSAFNVLPLEDSMNYVYLLYDLGRDEVVKTIDNGSEYQLGEGEFLYIEYTPSVTADDGTTTKASQPVTRVYEKGTIIRPSGFEQRFIASDSLYKKGTSWVKQVKFFPSTGAKIVNLHSLGANEQIEIRDLAEVILNRQKLEESGIDSLLVYKNFDNALLEGTALRSVEERSLPRQYTLGEGEYIFYTDANKQETAYFTTGTLVTVSGGVRIPRAPKIDLGNLLDNGLQDIPWHVIPLYNNNEIRFTEYQYKTLSEGDTIDTIKFITSTTAENNSSAGTSTEIEYLDENWRSCSGEISYFEAADKEKLNKLILPAILITNPRNDGASVITNEWNGWDVCSMLEFNVSSDTAQSLRVSDKVETALTLATSEIAGSSTDDTVLELESDCLNVNPLYFKTNLNCKAIGNKATKDTLNPIDAKLVDQTGFIVKTFSLTEPLLVETLPNSVAPNIIEQLPEYAASDKPYDISNWVGTPVPEKDFSDTWTRINLSQIASEGTYDKALKLPVLIPTGTYGIASFYVKYTTSLVSEEDLQTYIEMPVGFNKADLTILNAKTDIWESRDSTNRLFLNPGLNCIKITKSCDLFIKSAISAQGDFLFDDLRLVQTETLSDNLPSNGINLEQIDYQMTSNGGTGSSETRNLEELLLADIKTLDIDREFYYNVPVEQNLSIDFNQTRTSQDSLMNPSTLYDLNNVNNSFVISKLDIDYLDTGLQIARTSKIN